MIPRNEPPDEPVIAGTTLTVASSDLAAVQTLYVQCHRCGFYDAPEFEALTKPLVKVRPLPTKKPPVDELSTVVRVKLVLAVGWK